MENNMENTELLVPIIGLQGVGKSTLLNAVLGENALPAEADETTCIPVEIRYGEKATKLFYQSAEEKKIDTIYIKNIWGFTFFVQIPIANICGYSKVSFCLWIIVLSIE